MTTQMLDEQGQQTQANAENVAYATVRLRSTSEAASDPDPQHDNYFIATQILSYQFLHAAAACTQQVIPFMVLVTDRVSEEKQACLRKDGCTSHAD